MLTHYPKNSLGNADHGWLKSKHHFSFANYYNPARMGFGTLRVVNDDWVAPGMGFGAHPHRNMEIISFIRSGAITHQDSMGNKGITEQGEVQVMSAGTGITHSEYNLTDEPLTFYQIWIQSNQHNVESRWESKKFPTQAASSLSLLVSGYPKDADSALFINQQARIYGGKLAKGTLIKQPIDHQAYVLASAGEFIINDESASVKMSKGDGAEVTQTKTITLTATTECELIIIDSKS